MNLKAVIFSKAFGGSISRIFFLDEYILFSLISCVKVISGYLSMPALCENELLLQCQFIQFKLFNHTKNSKDFFQIWIQKKNAITEENAIKHQKKDNSESETNLEIGCYLPNWISQRRPLLSSSFNFKACSLSLPLLVNCVCACRSIHDETCPF